jgi:hypothetical protein
VFIFNINRSTSQCVAESPALASLLTITRSAEPVCVLEEQSVAKEPLPATHNAEGRRLSTCREKPETWPSLKTSERRHGCSEICLRRSLHVIFKMVYIEIKWSILKIVNMENDQRNNNWRSIEEKIVLNMYIGRVLIFGQNDWSAAYDVI